MRKNINKFVLGSCLLLVCVLGKAQTDTLSDQGQADLLYGASWVSDPHDRLITLNDLLKSGRITKESYIAGIYTRLAETTHELNFDLLEDCGYNDSLSEECKVVFDEIFAYYDKALAMCEFCAPTNILSRYGFEENYPYYEKQAEKDMAALKEFGYKEDRTGVPLGFTYTKTPKSDYIGIELSPVGFLQSRYKMRNLNKKTGKREVINSNLVPLNYQAFTCGFNKNITRTGYEVWFSMGQLTSPLVINPVKFGFTENYVSNEKVHWFYRPELGLGWGVFSVNCGYNLVFKKAFRREDNKWFLTARISYPIIKAFD